MIIADKPAWIKKSRLGGIKRNQLYGNPGTAQGRSHGGRASIKFFQTNSDYAKTVGFDLKKEINCPARSVELAECIGIILGDGGIRNGRQLTISFNHETDSEYAVYVANLIKRLFSIAYFISKHRSCKGSDIVVGGVRLVEFLKQQGIREGNKVENQVDVPSWIRKRPKYRLACLRGLMDTDGGLYRHRYRVNGKAYEYLKLCFTNHSLPLLRFVVET